MTIREKKHHIIGRYASMIATPILLLACATPTAFAMAGTDTHESATSTVTADSANSSEDNSNNVLKDDAINQDDTDDDSSNTSSGRVHQTVDSTNTNTTDSEGVNQQVAGPVPNIIITNFDYGGNTIAAGGNFNLSFTFQNMGKVAVDNMVVTVDGGESFAIAGGTNTFYFDRLAAGYAMTQSLPMQAVTGAQSGAQGITVSFKYEYVDGGARSSNSSDIKISVPISQPDRFELNDPVPPDEATVGTETTISMNYVNKGKSDISNVEASIEGEGIEATNTKQYVGNVASGATGSIGFAFTPTTVGEINAKLRVTYEDPDGKTQTKEFPVTITATDAEPVIPADDPVVPDDNYQGIAGWVWAVIAVVVLAAVAVTVTLVRRRRKKAKQTDIDEEWDDWTSANSAAGKIGESSSDTVDVPAVDMAGNAASSGEDRA
ncbi:ABC transporter permease [Bifidobacterium hapali]|uniref:ABC transporter permease n=1 Tax=Bifidobacterium hapali TaxID=1630172 RepID=A0A261FT33_9BIFI|nr:ABC transporter permease [Bifidobacterium hapali]OZG62135.1 ABC transporter permease [Bifidobacterium hapali]